MTQRILILGVGNPLMEDEGVGIAALEHLRAGWTFPDDVELLDCGTMGMGILNLFLDAGRVLVLDAVDGTGNPPGTVVRMRPEDLAEHAVPHSLHDIRLVDVLRAAEMIGRRPDVEFVGVQVASMRGMTEGLTSEVAASLPNAAVAAVAVLAEWGIVAEERA